MSLEKSNLHVLESPLSLAGPQKATLQCILVHLAKVLFPPGGESPLTMLALVQGSHSGGSTSGQEQDGSEQPCNCIWPDNGIFFRLLFLLILLNLWF